METQIINVSVENNRDALHTAAVQDLLREKNVDVLIVMPSFGNDAGLEISSSTDF